MQVQTSTAYTLVPADRQAVVQNVEILQRDLTALRVEVRELHSGHTVLVRDAAHQQTTLYLLAAALAISLIISWLRGREAVRVRALLEQQAARLDGQDQRINKAVEEMAGERAKLATERARLHVAVDDVAHIGGELKSDLAAGVEIFKAAAERHADAMEESQQAVLALIVELRRKVRGDGHVSS